MLAAGADFVYPGIVGPRARGTDAINWYIGHLRWAMPREAEVARAFVEVGNLVRPPGTLFAPSVVLRVLTARLGSQWPVQ